MTPFKFEKMNDVDVVIRVWDSLNLLSYDFATWMNGWGPIDEYDSYVEPTIHLLKSGADLDQLTKWFYCVSFTIMMNEKERRQEVKCEYHAWCMMQVWKNHLKDESNIRRFPASWSAKVNQWNRGISKFEIIQWTIEKWDYKRSASQWYHGLNSLSDYDQLALEVWYALRANAQTRDIQNILLSQFCNLGEYERLNKSRTIRDCMEYGKILTNKYYSPGFYSLRSKSYII